MSPSRDGQDTKEGWVITHWFLHGRKTSKGTNRLYHKAKSILVVESGLADAAVPPFTMLDVMESR